MIRVSLAHLEQGEPPGHLAQGVATLDASSGEGLGRRLIAAGFINLALQRLADVDQPLPIERDKTFINLTCVVAVIEGLHRALEKGRRELGISSRLIMCFLRHLDEKSAFDTLRQAMPHREHIVGVGLDSAEAGNPPQKFQRVFEAALESGFLSVAHAGEEGPASYISDAISLLKVSRIDHGVRCVEDPELVKQLITTRMPLTVCPLSNIKLRVFDNMRQHNIVELLRQF